MTSFKVVKLMFRPLLSFKQSLLYLVADVQTCCLDHYTSCGVGDVHDKFQGCSKYVQVATEFIRISTLPFCIRSGYSYGPVRIAFRLFVRQLLT